MSNLNFYGCDLKEIAEEFGTPLYVVSEDYVRERCGELRSTFTEKYPNTRAVFASKAFQTLDMCRIIKSEGLGMDVVSGGELYTALKAGIEGKDLVFHGNSKTERELREALDADVGDIVVDNMSELKLLDELAGAAGKKAHILIRVTPGVDSHTHKFISTGQEDSKFGFSVEEVLDHAAEAAIESKNIDFRGFHFHVGSQLLENDSHLMAVDVMLKLLKDVKEKYGFKARELNCGGGFGVHYAGDPKRRPAAYFTDPIMEKVNSFYKELGDDRPMITVEPGRWIVSEAGITLYEVGSVKVNAAGRRYAGIDGGMPDNIRTALYDAKYEVEAVEKKDEPHTVKTTIAGKCCESGDIIAWDVMLPELERGDHVAVLCTGAYNYTMASNYNRLPKPAVVMIKDGNARLSVRRETYEDMLARETV